MSAVTSSDGTAIAFERTGVGPPIVIVDGAFSHRAINPTSPKLASQLASRFSVFTYDRRGRGESGDTKPYAAEREVEDIDAIIADAGGSAFVLGGSSGALLALDAAARGSAIAKLAVYEPPLIVDDSHPPLPDDYLTRLEELLAADRRSEAVTLLFTVTMRLPDEAVAAMRHGPFWAELEKGAPTLAHDWALFGDALSGKPLSSERWGSTTVPTLVIDGGAGEAFMHRGADALANLLPNAQRRTLAGQTHDVAAEALAPVLAEFFRAEGAKSAAAA